jgi:hypothetical protein
MECCITYCGIRSYEEACMTIASLDLSKVDPFDADEPYQLLYREAICG